MSELSESVADLGWALDAAGHRVETYLRRNGFWDDPWSVETGFAELLVLLHSEISEALEAYRERGLESWTEARDYGQGPVAKPMGVGAELGDVFVRLLHTARRLNIDLAGEFGRVMDHNECRPFKHGKRL